MNFNTFKLPQLNRHAFLQKAGNVQVLPLLILSLFAVTTFLIVNTVQNRSQELRSRAQVYTRYNCVSGSCVSDPNGEFLSLGECTPVCFQTAPSPTPAVCTTGATQCCVTAFDQDGSRTCTNGQWGNCTSCTNGCSNTTGRCIVVSASPSPSPQTRYSCQSNGQCAPSTNGPFTNFATCDANCDPSLLQPSPTISTTPDCADTYAGKCVTSTLTCSPSTSYGRVNCLSTQKCVPETASCTSGGGGTSIASPTPTPTSTTDSGGGGKPLAIPVPVIKPSPSPSPKTEQSIPTGGSSGGGTHRAFSGTTGQCTGSWVCRNNTTGKEVRYNCSAADNNVSECSRRTSCATGNTLVQGCDWTETKIDTAAQNAKEAEMASCNFWCAGCSGFCGDEGVAKGQGCYTQQLLKCDERPPYMPDPDASPEPGNPATCAGGVAVGACARSSTTTWVRCTKEGTAAYPKYVPDTDGTCAASFGLEVASADLPQNENNKIACRNAIRLGATCGGIASPGDSCKTGSFSQQYACECDATGKYRYPTLQPKTSDQCTEIIIQSQQTQAQQTQDAQTREALSREPKGNSCTSDGRGVKISGDSLVADTANCGSDSTCVQVGSSEASCIPVNLLSDKTFDADLFVYDPETNTMRLRTSSFVPTASLSWDEMCSIVKTGSGNDVYVCQKADTLTLSRNHIYNSSGASCSGRDILLHIAGGRIQEHPPGYSCKKVGERVYFAYDAQSDEVATDFLITNHFNTDNREAAYQAYEKALRGCYDENGVLYGQNGTRRDSSGAWQGCVPVTQKTSTGLEITLGFTWEDVPVQENACGTRNEGDSWVEGNSCVSCAKLLNGTYGAVRESLYSQGRGVDGGTQIINNNCASYFGGSGQGFVSNEQLFQLAQNNSTILVPTGTAANLPSDNRTRLPGTPYCSNDGQCRVGVQTGTTVTIRGVSVSDLQLASQCPASCAIVGANSGTSTSRGGFLNLTEYTNICSSDGTSVISTTQVSGGRNTTTAQTTTTRCASGICSQGKCVEGYVTLDATTAQVRLYAENDTFLQFDPVTGQELAYTVVAVKDSTGKTIGYDTRINWDETPGGDQTREDYAQTQRYQAMATFYQEQNAIAEKERIDQLYAAYVASQAQTISYTDFIKPDGVYDSLTQNQKDELTTYVQTHQNDTQFKDLQPNRECNDQSSLSMINYVNTLAGSIPGNTANLRSDSDNSFCIKNDVFDNDPYFVQLKEQARADLVNHCVASISNGSTDGFSGFGAVTTLSTCEQLSDEYIEEYLSLRLEKVSYAYGFAPAGYVGGFLAGSGCALSGFGTLATGACGFAGSLLGQIPIFEASPEDDARLNELWAQLILQPSGYASISNIDNQFYLYNAVNRILAQYGKSISDDPSTWTEAERDAISIAIQGELAFARDFDTSQSIQKGVGLGTQVVGAALMPGIGKLAGSATARVIAQVSQQAITRGTVWAVAQPVLLAGVTYAGQIVGSQVFSQPVAIGSALSNQYLFESRNFVSSPTQGQLLACENQHGQNAAQCSSYKDSVSAELWENIQRTMIVTAVSDLVYSLPTARSEFIQTRRIIDQGTFAYRAASADTLLPANVETVVARLNSDGGSIFVPGIDSQGNVYAGTAEFRIGSNVAEGVRPIELVLPVAGGDTNYYLRVIGSDNAVVTIPIDANAQTSPVRYLDAARSTAVNTEIAGFLNTDNLQSAFNDALTTRLTDQGYVLDANDPNQRPFVTSETLTTAQSQDLTWIDRLFGNTGDVDLAGRQLTDADGNTIFDFVNPQAGDEIRNGNRVLVRYESDGQGGVRIAEGSTTIARSDLDGALAQRTTPTQGRQAASLTLDNFRVVTFNSADQFIASIGRGVTATDNAITQLARRFGIGGEDTEIIRTRQVVGDQVLQQVVGEINLRRLAGAGDEAITENIGRVLSRDADNHTQIYNDAYTQAKNRLDAAGVADSETQARQIAQSIENTFIQHQDEVTTALRQNTEQISVNFNETSNVFTRAWDTVTGSLARTFARFTQPQTRPQAPQTAQGLPIDNNQVRAIGQLVADGKVTVENGRLTIAGDVPVEVRRVVDTVNNSGTQIERTIRAATFEGAREAYRRGAIQQITDINQTTTVDANGRVAFRIADPNAPESVKQLVDSINADLRVLEEKLGFTIRGSEANELNQMRIIADAILNKDPAVTGRLYESITGSGKSSTMIPMISALLGKYSGKTVLVVMPKSTDIGSLLSPQIKAFMADIGISVATYEQGTNARSADFQNANVIVTTKDVIFDSIRTDVNADAVMQKVRGAALIADEAQLTLRLEVDYNVSSGALRKISQMSIVCNPLRKHPIEIGFDFR